MGRPLKKSLFGANAKNNLKVQFYNSKTLNGATLPTNSTAASKPGYIIKQVGSRRFKCADVNGNTAICKLVNKAAGDLVAGEMSITVKLDNNNTVAHVQKISSRMLTVYAGVGVPALTRYPWNFSVATNDGAAQVEEAGTSTTVISTSTGAINLEGDIEA